MISMKASTGGSDALARFRWNAAAVRWADEIGPIARTRLKEAAPVGKGPRAHRFADSIRYQRATDTGELVRAEFTANTPYARFVIEPTRPHLIVPKAARMLHWTGAEGGSHFARRVRHPGTKGNPFHLHVMRQLTPLAQESYTRIMREALGGL